MNAIEKVKTEQILIHAERRLSKLYGSSVKIFMQVEENGTINENQIIMYVSSISGVGPIAMKSKTRLRPVVEARQIAMTLIRNHTRMPLKKIGLMFSGRDHSTVIHAIQTTEDLIKTDKKFRSLWSQCEIIVAQHLEKSKLIQT